jgi:hypothetical protein
MAQGAARDIRLDVFRGVALLMIFINHMPGNGLQMFTLQRFGFADAAEVFVLLAGIAAVLAYGRTQEVKGWSAMVRAIAARMGKLYLAHLLVFAVVLAVAGFAAHGLADDSYLDTMGLDLVASDPLTAVLAAATLTYLPYYLDILPLYIVLLALLPLVLAGFNLRWWLPLAVSVAVYALVQVFPLNLPNMHTAQVWFFNPFAWQLLFVIGATIGHVMRTATGAVVPPALRGWLTLSAVVYVAFALVVAAPWQAVPALANAVVLPLSALPMLDKTHLSPFRLVDILAKFWLVAVFVAAGAAFLRSRLAAAFALAGRHSLEVFSLGIVLSLLGSIALKELNGTLAAQLGVTLAGAAMMLALAHGLEARRGARRSTRPAATTAAAPHGLAGGAGQ